MKLEGSCHCGRVRFSLESAHPYPFNLCYCSICRKTAGGGGFAINLGGEADTLRVEGEQHVTVYHVEEPGGQSPLGRHFCSCCGSMLWAWDSRWPALVHPFASAVDTPLPVPPDRVHLMLASKAPWVEPAVGPEDRCFDQYPDDSIAEWHARRGLVS
ncbi:MAG: GFA family protein [Thalassobaculum sp.]|jgi:hypothetical protein